MGDKFADNTRFLFQYLYENKNKYGIKNVVWVTRDIETYKTLNDMGYTVAKMHSIKSYYFHLRAGIHLICNMYYKTNSYKGDILGNLSFLATKVQLFHGVGIKACGKMRNKKESKKNDTEAFLSSIINNIALLSPGGWNNCYFIATSEENKRIAEDDYGYTEDKIIVTGYPRLCECVRHLPVEEEIIDSIKRKSMEGYIIILYLPTFREVSDSFIQPSSIDGFSNFIIDNKLYWIEKRHSADLTQRSEGFKCIHSLSSDFDVNTLYPYIDLLITDYSSAASDAAYWNKLTLEYCPDFNKYKNDDRGFVAPFNQYHVNDFPVTDSKVLFDSILNEIENGRNASNTMKRNAVKTLLFGNIPYDYNSIVLNIIKAVHS